MAAAEVQILRLDSDSVATRLEVSRRCVSGFPADWVGSVSSVAWFSNFKTGTGGFERDISLGPVPSLEFGGPKLGKNWLGHCLLFLFTHHVLLAKKARLTLSKVSLTSLSTER